MRITEIAPRVGTQIHTAPEAFGKAMSEVKPRIAVAYYFFKDPDTTAGVNDRIRKTYDGPLSLAEDFMVWNITKDKIAERMAVVEERTWAPPPASPAQVPNMADRKEMEQQLGAKLSYSDFVKEGVWGGVEGVLRDVYKEASDKLGREFPYPETTE